MRRGADERVNQRLIGVNGGAKSGQWAA